MSLTAAKKPEKLRKNVFNNNHFSILEIIINCVYVPLLMEYPVCKSFEAGMIHDSR